MEKPANRSYSIVLAVSQDPSHTGGENKPAAEFNLLAEKPGVILAGNTGYTKRCSLLTRIERSTALDISQARYILKTYPNADAYVSFSERVGIPLAMLLRNRKQRPAHIMIAHRLDTNAKRVMEMLGRWTDGVDRVVTLCTAQQRFGESLFGSKSRLVLAGLTDDNFYSPSEGEQDTDDYILSVGSENRDYETLIEAIGRTDLELKILSSSPWCRKKKAGLGAVNGRVEFLPRVEYPELRELYQRARLVVVPLHDVPYAAGLNGVMEAFCVNKPVIVSSSHGISDYVKHMHNAYVVPVSSVNDMVAALTTVHNDRVLQSRLKTGTIQAVREYANLRTYTARLGSEILDSIVERVV